MVAGSSFKQLGLGILRYLLNWQISPRVIVCTRVWNQHHVASLSNNQILLLQEYY